MFAVYAVAAVVSITPIAETTIACTRTLYVGDDNTVITGRNMDWMEDMASNLWVFPAGMKRDGAAGAKSIQWTSKFGSVVVSGYEAGSTDGLNEKGLVANVLYLVESDYGKPDGKKPTISIAAWAQYVLDNKGRPYKCLPYDTNCQTLPPPGTPLHSSTCLWSTAGAAT